MASANPSISVIIASYNYQRFISETLDSILNQSFSDWEAIVVDDGSSDNSVSIIEDYCSKDSRFRLLQHPGGVNQGLQKTIELGLSHAKGQLIAFCESDDALFPDSFISRKKIFDEYKDCALVFNDVELVGDEQDLKSYHSFRDLINNRSVNEIPAYDFASLFVPGTTIFTFSSVMVRKNILQRCDFDSPNTTFLDTWLWKQIIFKYKIAYLRTKQTYFRIHPKSQIAKITAETKTTKVAKTYKRHNNRILAFLKAKSPVRFFLIKLYLKLLG